MAWYTVLIRLGVALVIGLVIGFEREHHHRPAGMKTHIMVCMGAAIISIIQVFIAEESIAKVLANPELSEVLKVDMGRLGAQVVSGIGFLGAGTILQYKGSIKGLTSAATLWLTACIGLAVGMGYYTIAAGAFILVMIVLIGLRFIQGFAVKNRPVILELELESKKTALSNIEAYCNNYGIKIDDISVEKAAEDKESETYHCLCTIRLPRTSSTDNVIKGLIKEEGILHVSEFSE